MSKRPSRLLQTGVESGVELEVRVSGVGRKRARHLLITAVVVLHGCSAALPLPPPPPAPRPAAAAHSWVRVRNVGTVTSRELVVMFPFDTVPFGDIKGGATTRSMNVPLG